MTVNTTTTTLELCELRADHVVDYKQAPKGYLTLACSVQGEYGGPYTYRYWREDAFRLKLTDGTTVGPVIHPLVNLYKGQAPQAADLAFDIKEPAQGTYTLQVVASSGSGGDAKPEVKEIPVTLPGG